MWRRSWLLHVFMVHSVCISSHSTGTALTELQVQTQLFLQWLVSLIVSAEPSLSAWSKCSSLFIRYWSVPDNFWMHYSDSLTGLKIAGCFCGTCEFFLVPQVIIFFLPVINFPSVSTVFLITCSVFLVFSDGLVSKGVSIPEFSNSPQSCSSWSCVKASCFQNQN